MRAQDRAGSADTRASTGAEERGQALKASAGWILQSLEVGEGGRSAGPGSSVPPAPLPRIPGRKASPHHTRRRRHDPRRTLTLLAGRERRPLRESGSRGSLRGLQPRFQFKLPATATGFRFARFRDGPNASSKPIGHRKQKWANRLPRTRIAGSDWFFRTDLKIKLRGPALELGCFFVVVGGRDHVRSQRLGDVLNRYFRKSRGTGGPMGRRGLSPTTGGIMLSGELSRYLLIKHTI